MLHPLVLTPGEVASYLTCYGRGGVFLFEVKTAKGELMYVMGDRNFVEDLSPFRPQPTRRRPSDEHPRFEVKYDP